MLHLPNVTLLCVDCVSPDEAIAAVERSRAGITFGAVKLLTSLPLDVPYRVTIDPITHHTAYSVFMVKEVHKFIDTPRFLVVQHDGWVLHPDAWDPAWESLDYIGPLFTQYDQVGSGGFSLRSRALHQFVAERTPPWDGSTAGAITWTGIVGSYEDGIFALQHRAKAEAAGFHYATIQQASRFAYGGNANQALRCPRPFGFHRWTNVVANDVKTLNP